MQQSDFISTSSASDNNGTLANAPQQLHSLFTIKRVSYTIAGAFVFVGVAAAISAVAPTDPTQNPSYKVQHAAAAANPTPSTSGSTAASSSSSVEASMDGSEGASNVQLNVNGQDIPVVDGGIQQTTTNADGSQTTVRTSSNVSAQGDTTNSAKTSFSLHVTSSSGVSTTP